MEEPEELQQEENELREQQEDAPRPVASSMVAEIAYEPESEELTVVFNNGHEGSYQITPVQWKELLDAPSTGKWMWENVL